MHIDSIQSLSMLIGIGILGIFVLGWSANKTVEKSINLARFFGRSEMFIGLTILSIGTSIPEISSNIIGGFGVLLGKLNYEITSATVIGGNVGSSIVQLTLITGLIIVLMGQVKLKKEFISENYVTLIVTFLFMFIVGYDGTITQSEGALMLLVFALYLYFLYRQEHAHHIKEHPHHQTHAHTPLQDALWIIAGFTGVFLGSSVALESLQQIVVITGLSGGLLGIMTLGVASALPEFITSLTALRKGAADVSIGTLIGSNIVNPLMGIGVGAVISGYAVPQGFSGIDVPIQVLVSCILLLWIIHHKRILPKYAGYILITTYFIYLLLRIYFFPTDFGNY